ncbi:Replicase polyprotein 1ab [Micromonospora sp. DR5-3]|uniref:Replicase polyprotein 1ab n=1 Tax=unclassified Micromonospora TaxID=2617518 RepID=UPI0021043392|nr:MULTISPECIES: Replicase polyprotein 1ab [unclassified Micromonospora]MCW3819536.1 Replicase polyprotein 1ab [Micromonospora sp. DR5-3]
MATGLLIDDNPVEALAHAMAARRLASRIAAVREAVGLAAYHAGEWQTAIAELRTYHRMTGLQSHLAVLADCERALGRPERAIDLFRGADREKLDQAVAIELLIVAAGARGDLGQKDAAVAMLQVRELTSDSTEPWAARLRYAYADALLAVGRREEAREWFSRAADVDAEGETDAAERLLELDGVIIEGDDEDDEELAAGPGAPGAVPARPDADLTRESAGGDADELLDRRADDADDLDEDDDLDGDADEDTDDEGDLDDDEDDEGDLDDDVDGDARLRGQDRSAVDVDDRDVHDEAVGYRDRNAADLGDDELTDATARSLADDTRAATGGNAPVQDPADAGPGDRTSEVAGEEADRR